MTGQTTTDNTPSIWKWENTAHITKAGMEAAFATASLSTAIVAILILTGTIAAPFAVFSMFANPIGIAILSFAFLYFAAQAVSSYQQMKANLLIENATATVEAKAEAAVEAAVNTAEIGKKVDDAVKNKKLVTETELTNATKDLATKDELKTKTDKLATKDELAKLGAKANAADLTALTGRVGANETALKSKAEQSALDAKANATDLTTLTGRVDAKLNKANLDAEMKTVLETSESEVTKHLGSKYAPIAPTHV